MSKNNEILKNDLIFNLNDFNGPLDLLLELIKKKNITLFEVDMVDLANQYLMIIENLKENEIDIASEYMLMASELIYLKSRLLLNDPEIEQEVEDDKKRILNLLAEYQEFKLVAKSLKIQELKRKEIFIKQPSDVSSFIIEKDPSALDGYGTTPKLITTLRKMFERVHAEKLRQIKLDTFNLSPAERIIQIREIIDSLNSNTIPFDLIFSVPSLNHFVITLIAVLDMCRKEELILFQSFQFDEIIIKKGVNY